MVHRDILSKNIKNRLFTKKFTIAFVFNLPCNNNLSPELLFDSFTEKKINYSLRSKSNFRLPESKTKRFGTNSLIFIGSFYEIYSQKPLKKLNLS